MSVRGLGVVESEHFLIDDDRALLVLDRLRVVASVIAYQRKPAADNIHQQRHCAQQQRS